MSERLGRLVKVSELFHIKYGNSLELINLVQCKSTDKNAVPFVSRTENNNGVSAFVEEEIQLDKNPAHTLTVAVGGSVLSTFYQPLSYYTGFHILILEPKKGMSIIEMLFYAKCISSNKYKYNYGRQANRTLKDILIPAEIPNKLKEEFVAFGNKKFYEINKRPFFEARFKIDFDSWKSFKLKELFTITGSKTTPLLELEEYGKGKFSYVTTQATNNGVEGFYDFYTEEGNVLTVDSAVLGYCSYQPFDFSASDHVEKLIPKFKMNKYIALFLVTIMNLEQYRYNYGRKCSQTRMKQISIKLPSKKGQPDFEYMENFIKSLPYSNAI